MHNNYELQLCPQISWPKRIHPLKGVAAHTVLIALELHIIAYRGSRYSAHESCVIWELVGRLHCEHLNCPQIICGYLGVVKVFRISDIMHIAHDLGNYNNAQFIHQDMLFS